MIYKDTVIHPKDTKRKRERCLKRSETEIQREKGQRHSDRERRRGDGS